MMINKIVSITQVEGLLIIKIKGIGIIKVISISNTRKIKAIK